MAVNIDILTLFPDMFQGPLTQSIVGRARQQGTVQISIWDIRDFSLDKHRIVDDTPYGGGAGMVMKPDVVVRAIEHVRAANPGPVIYLTPQGKPLTQEVLSKATQWSDMILLCGHYEGIDERARELSVDHEVSIGDYVLTGGELPAMVWIDGLIRLIPGVLGDVASAEHDSFFNGLLEHPHYTRPREYRGIRVPDVLLSGHHGQIAHWRMKESLRRTWQRRPDLLSVQELPANMQQLLLEIQREERKEEHETHEYPR